MFRSAVLARMAAVSSTSSKLSAAKLPNGCPLSLTVTAAETVSTFLRGSKAFERLFQRVKRAFHLVGLRSTSGDSDRVCLSESVKMSEWQVRYLAGVIQQTRA